LLPGRESLTNGDIPKKQKMVKEVRSARPRGAYFVEGRTDIPVCPQMLHRFLRSIYYPDEQTGRSFAADAIIANPPSFAHVHIAEMTGLPLVISFSEYREELRSRGD
jgi:sterol 3beta-glucosyltransferase